MFFQFFFMGWKTDFTVLGFFFTVFSTSEENGCNFIFANSFVKGDNAERVLVRRAKIDAIHGGIAVGKLLMGCN